MTHLIHYIFASIIFTSKICKYLAEDYTVGQLRSTTQRLLILLIFIGHLSIPSVYGQDVDTTLKGRVADADNQPLEMVNVLVKGTSIGVVTNKRGEFEISGLHEKSVIIQFSSVGYGLVERVTDLKNNPFIFQVLKPDLRKIEEVVVEGHAEKGNTISILPKLTERLPTLSGGVETLIKTLPGVSTNNELSSQYSVRGGNFDENLVYVNGIEIIRPFLVKSGEHEGLSFINSDMVSSINFSAGGFDASYGDKMSSVLDITYRKPKVTSASAEIGALGASAHFEGSALKGRFTHITGIRYKNTAYLLGTLDKKGEYNPSFTDIQSYMTFEVNPKLSLGFLGNYSVSSYQFVPESQVTRFGTMTTPMEFVVYFEGQERDKFENHLASFNADYHPNKQLTMRFQGGNFHSLEKESYDILGQYYLSDINAPKQNYPDSTLVTGVGSYLDHARNVLEANVSSFEHTGSFSLKHQTLRWGLKYQHELISDHVNEWEMRDSVGYSLPTETGKLELFHTVTGNNRLQSNRISGFLMDGWNSAFKNGDLSVTGGLRFQYWDFNQQTIISPRISGSWKTGSNKNRTFRASWGVYSQMPFYKELRNREAQIVAGLKAQKATHYLIGYDENFKADDRPFRFTAEIWYKNLRDLIPYKVDNLNISYLPGELANGYAAGIDFKLNGEFVPGMQSWASLSFMKTEEDIVADYFYKDPSNINSEKIYPGYLPRPTDQRVNFSLFFQDFFPGYPSVKMSLTLFYGSRLPFGPPQWERYMDVFRMPPYRRADVGFSKILIDEKKPGLKRKGHFGIKDAWIGLELFNMFDINNTVSYYWITDIDNAMHAVPNYLTGRRINLKLSVKF